MGSFAYSLHVKSGDTEAVSAAIEKMMVEAGYRVTEEAPVIETPWSESPDLRALYVFDAHNGWSGVLDSDMTQSEELGAELSRRLDTYAIQVMVNDSDSWHYLLFHNGDMVDEFDSSEFSGFDEGEFGLETLSEIGGLAKLAKEIKKRTEGIVEQLSNAREQIKKEMPADIHSCLEKLRQGTASPAEKKRFADWTMNLQQGFSEQIMGDINKLKKPREVKGRNSRGHKSGLLSHLVKLRAILAGDVADERVLGVLEKQALFAEQVLGEFFELLGVQPVFANLSYAYMKDFGEADLSAYGVRLARHLKFKTVG